MIIILFWVRESKWVPSKLVSSEGLSEVRSMREGEEISGAALGTFTAVNVSGMLQKLKSAEPPRHLSMEPPPHQPCGADIRPPKHPRLPTLSIFAILPPVISITHSSHTHKQQSLVRSLTHSQSIDRSLQPTAQFHSLNSLVAPVSHVSDLVAMALAMTVRTNVGSVVAAPVVAGIPSFKQPTSVRFTSGKLATSTPLMHWSCISGQGSKFDFNVVSETRRVKSSLVSSAYTTVCALCHENLRRVEAHDRFSM